MATVTELLTLKLTSRIILLMLFTVSAQGNNRGPTLEEYQDKAEKCDDKTHFLCVHDGQCCDLFSQKCSSKSLRCINVTIFPEGDSLTKKKICCQVIQDQTPPNSKNREWYNCMYLIGRYNWCEDVINNFTNGKPRLVSNNENPTDGDSITLMCVTPLKGIINYLFKKDNKVVAHQAYKTHTINPAKIGASDGNYTCAARISAVSYNISDIYTIKLKPKQPVLTSTVARDATVLVNSQFEIICQTSSNGADNYIFLQNGLPIHNQNLSQYKTRTSSSPGSYKYSCKVAINGVTSLQSQKYPIIVESPNQHSILGLKIGGPIFIIGIVLGIVICLWCRKKKKNAHKGENKEAETEPLADDVNKNQPKLSVREEEEKEPKLETMIPMNALVTPRES